VHVITIAGLIIYEWSKVEFEIDDALISFVNRYSSVNSGYPCLGGLSQEKDLIIQYSYGCGIPVIPQLTFLRNQGRAV